MNKTIFSFLIVLLLSVSLCAQGGKEAPAQAGSQSSDVDGDGIPFNAEQLIGTNPYQADTDGDSISDSEDKNPLDSGMSPSENSTTPLPVQITDVRVEDNFKAADHLEISLKNTGTTALELDACFITITDKKTGATEKYFVDMHAFSVKPRTKETLHFDNGTASGHFPGNNNGLYRTAADGLIFSVTLQSTGFKPFQLEVEKAPGTAEVAD